MIMLIQMRIFYEIISHLSLYTPCSMFLPYTPQETSSGLPVPLLKISDEG